MGHSPRSYQKIQMKFPRTSISASLINCYIDCPLGFKLTVIDELMVEEGPALEIGSMVDEMFKAFHKGKDPYAEGKKKFLNGRFTKQTINNFGIARKLIDAYVKDADKFVNPEFDIRFEVPIIKPSTNERIDGITLKGFCDGFDDGAIKELKTTSEPYTQERVDFALQGTIYAYGKWVEDRKIYPVDYIVIGKKTKKVDRFRTTRTLQDFDNLFETIKMFIADVEAENFDPNPDRS